MIWSAVAAAFFAGVTWLVSLLPSTACDELEFSALDVGWLASIFDVPALVAAGAFMVSVEISLVAFRGATWVWQQLKW